MTSLDLSEKTRAQIPAADLLAAAGYTPLDPEALDAARESRDDLLLPNVLAERIIALNTDARGAPTRGQADEAIRRLRADRALEADSARINHDAYEALLYGVTVPGGPNGRKSRVLRLIDWENPENNTYHQALEVYVRRRGGDHGCRFDLVLFVNGMPFVIIENKAPDTDVMRGVRDLAAYQDPDQVPQAFRLAQVLIATNKNDARYAAVGNHPASWLTWREEADDDADLRALIDADIDPAAHAAIRSGRLAGAPESRPGRPITEQDRTLYALCRPARLLRLSRIYTVIEGATRKIARHQQYFAVEAALARLTAGRSAAGDGRGGVIWHTQGSGKSLTMVMLVKALVFRNRTTPRIIIATDRDDLDKQIKRTFQNCDMTPGRARSGGDLIRRIAVGETPITTVINKFASAMQRDDFQDTSRDIYVLVDEAHRTQYGALAGAMQRILPNAAYIGFTGTPLTHKEKNTFRRFGGLIHTYVHRDALADRAIVPLLYEGRMIPQTVGAQDLDQRFEAASPGLDDNQRAALKRRFARQDELARTERTLQAKATDISRHYADNWKDTGFKGQIVAPTKLAAVRIKEILDDLDQVSSAVVISPPDKAEGDDEVGVAPKQPVIDFWDARMAEHGDEGSYNATVLDSFAKPDGVDLLIVVDKLLTGFDVPRNRLLYICRTIREHNLLQAIARVNRPYADGNLIKDNGIVVDYEGLLGELDESLASYDVLAGFDDADLTGAVIDVRAEIARLADAHADLWALFGAAGAAGDVDAMEEILEDAETREAFYRALKDFARILHLAGSSAKLYDVHDPQAVARFRADLRGFEKLRRTVSLRYDPDATTHEHDPMIRRLLDETVDPDRPEVVLDQLSLDEVDIDRLAEEHGVDATALADRIAGGIRRTISGGGGAGGDPALEKEFSDLLDKTIRDYRRKRLSARAYCERVRALADDLEARRTGMDAPEPIRGDADAAAYYRLFLDDLARLVPDESERNHHATWLAARTVETIRAHLIVDFWLNPDARNALEDAIDELLFAELDAALTVTLTEAQVDVLQRAIIAVARERFAS